MSAGTLAEIAPLYVDLATLGRMFSVPKRTLEMMIHDGRFTAAQGLRKVGNRYRVEIAAFKRALDAGAFAKEESR